MAIPNPKVLIGLDVSDSTLNPFFTLGDPVKGVLGNQTYPLGSTLFDVTFRVRDIRVTRGRSRDFSSFPAGEAVITLNNQDRAFDPLYEASPFYGSIIPRRELKIFSNDELIFTGWIDDWNLFYNKSGESLVDAIASDATGILAKQNLNAFTPSAQLTGARINEVLSRPEIDWGQFLREIDAGVAQVGTQPVPDKTPVLQYLQNVASAEPGALFINKSGNVEFVQKYAPNGTASPLLFSQNTEEGLPFDNLQVVYGTELLYNEVTISREGGGTAIASALDSQATYGNRELKIDGLLLSTDQQLVDLAVEYATLYSEPEYRFDSFEVKMHKLDPADQNRVLALEIGSIVEIKFTPNDIPPAIDRYLEVIRIDHFIRLDEHIITLGFRSVDTAPFTLDDAVFGRLDTAVLTK
ncbi:MAG: hypothetical protein EBS38_02700 [Actinobacteria bacterium]|nr:hypothetical protein [Actinomycetota bacterium]